MCRKNMWAGIRRSERKRYSPLTDGKNMERNCKTTRYPAAIPTRLNPADRMIFPPRTNRGENRREASKYAVAGTIPRLAKVTMIKGSRIQSAYTPLPSGPRIRAIIIEVTNPKTRRRIWLPRVTELSRRNRRMTLLENIFWRFHLKRQIYSPRSSRRTRRIFEKQTNFSPIFKGLLSLSSIRSINKLC